MDKWLTPVLEPLTKLEREHLELLDAKGYEDIRVVRDKPFVYVALLRLKTGACFLQTGTYTALGDIFIYESFKLAEEALVFWGAKSYEDEPKNYITRIGNP